MGFSFDSNSPPFSFMPTSFFSDLLNSPADAPSTAPSFPGRVGGSGVPKFKSVPPPSLPISPPSLTSPYSYFAIPAGLSPAQLLDSPVLLSSSHILPSPTTGALLGQSFNWKVNQPPQIKREDNLYSDFTFHPQHQIPAESRKQSNGEAGIDPSNHPAQNARDQTNSDDGYKWRKYGQKHVKGSENPRSYYKCTFPGCSTRKKVEMSLDGQITEIVYKGSHTHPKPVKARRFSSSSSSSVPATAGYNWNMVDGKENSVGDEQKEAVSSVTTPENSSISIADDEIDGGSQLNGGGEQNCDEDERHAKRWKGEVESECIAAATGGGQGSRTVREPRVVVQTTSDIDILDDGFRWRKYGQKVVKGNPNPRSYYKCTYPSCPVRKQVERAAQDIRSVITSYEGKHHHDIPAARGSSHSIARPTSDAVVSIMGVVRPSAVNYAPLPYNPNPAEGFEFSAFGRSMADYNSYGVNQQQSGSDHNNTKEEPRDDVFFHSFA